MTVGRVTRRMTAWVTAGRASVRLMATRIMTRMTEGDDQVHSSLNIGTVLSFNYIKYL